MRQLNINYYQWRRQGKGVSFHRPPQFGKFAKDGKQLTREQALRIDIKRKDKVSPNFSRYLLNNNI